MRFSFLLLLLALSLSSCIGAGNAPLRRESDSSREPFVGQSRDAILTRYGPPARTMKMDSGLKVLVYAREERTRIKGKTLYHTCNTWFWLKDSRVFKIEFRGDALTCNLFLNDGRRLVRKEIY